jgi:methyl-accepting chemotaxis protein
VSEIDVITREMIAAARETQHAVDTSQRAIDGLLNRSVNAQTSLGDISQMTNSLSSSVSEVTTSTSSLNHQMTDMEQTMAKVMGYSAANAAASEDTARAVSNVNRSAQELHKIIQGFIKGK